MVSFRRVTYSLTTFGVKRTINHSARIKLRISDFFAIFRIVIIQEFSVAMREKRRSKKLICFGQFNFCILTFVLFCKCVQFAIGYIY